MRLASRLTKISLVVMSVLFAMHTIPTDVYASVLNGCYNTILKYG